MNKEVEIHLQGNANNSVVSVTMLAGQELTIAEIADILTQYAGVLSRNETAKVQEEPQSKTETTTDTGQQTMPASDAISSEIDRSPTNG